MVRFLAAMAVMMMTATVVHADACTDSLGRMHSELDEERQWFAGAVEAQLGKGVTDFDFDYFVQCREMTPVARKRLRYVEEIIASHERMLKACNDSDDGEPHVGGYAATEMRSILKEYIAVCGDN